MAIATSVTKSHENGERFAGGGNPFVSGQRYICSALLQVAGPSQIVVVGDATSKIAYFKGFRGSSISDSNDNYMNYLGRPATFRDGHESAGVDSFVITAKCKSLRPSVIRKE